MDVLTMDDAARILLESLSVEALLALAILAGGGPWVARQLKTLGSGVADLLSRAQKHDVKNISKDMVDTAGKINDALERIRVSLNADRAYIFEFHNGAANASGVPFLKLSNTYERCKYGVQPQILHLQNLPVGVGYLFIRCINQGEDIYIPDIEMLKERDPSTYMLLDNQGVKSIYAVGVFDFDLSPVGFVGIDYCLEKRELNTHEAQMLRGCAIKLCGLLIASDHCTMTDEPRRPTQ